MELIESNWRELFVLIMLRDKQIISSLEILTKQSLVTLQTVFMLPQTASASLYTQLKLLKDVLVSLSALNLDLIELDLLKRISLFQTSGNIEKIIQPFQISTFRVCLDKKSLTNENEIKMIREKFLFSFEEYSQNRCAGSKISETIELECRLSLSLLGEVHAKIDERTFECVFFKSFDSDTSMMKKMLSQLLVKPVVN